MKTLIIIFFGLVSHVNQPWSLDNTAVLPAVHGHTPEMRIPKSSVVDPPPWLAEFEKPEVYVIPLQGVSVRIKNTRGIFSNKRPDFFSSVLRLKKLAPSLKLSRAVRKRTRSERVAAFVDYRGGRLSTQSFYAQKLIIPGGDPTGTCVACKVRYEADLRDDEAQLVFTQNGKERIVRVKGGSTLNVSNILAPDADPTEAHIGSAFSIFEAESSNRHFERGDPCDSSRLCDTVDELEAAAVAAAAEAGITLDEEMVGLAPFPGPDCTNSHYP